MVRASTSPPAAASSPQLLSHSLIWSFTTRQLTPPRSKFSPWTSPLLAPGSATIICGPTKCGHIDPSRVPDVPFFISDIEGTRGVDEIRKMGVVRRLRFCQLNTFGTDSRFNSTSLFLESLKKCLCSYVFTLISCCVLHFYTFVFNRCQSVNTSGLTRLLWCKVYHIFVKLLNLGSKSCVCVWVREMSLYGCLIFDGISMNNAKTQLLQD